MAPMASAAPRLLTLTEAADHVGASRITIKRAVDRGMLVSYRTNTNPYKNAPHLVNLAEVEARIRTRPCREPLAPVRTWHDLSTRHLCLLLSLLHRGQSIKEIANDMGTSYYSARYHLYALADRIGIPHGWDRMTKLAVWFYAQLAAEKPHRRGLSIVQPE